MQKVEIIKVINIHSCLIFYNANRWTGYFLFTGIVNLCLGWVKEFARLHNVNFVSSFSFLKLILS